MGWVSVLFGVSAGVVFAVEKAKAKRLLNRHQPPQHSEDAIKLSLSKDGTDSEENEKQVSDLPK